MEKFTMVFLDLDNTLVPSRIRKVVQHQLGLDIFEILSSTLLKKLQLSIIKAIDNIKTVIKKQNKQIIICIVSNGSNKWLDTLLKYSENKPNCHFSVLGKYLKQNQISMYSAMDEMYNFLKYKYDPKVASQMIKHAYNGKANNQSKWMWKYTTFSSILLQYKLKRNKICNHIVSIGDGSTEAIALTNYSKTFNIRCNHIKFLDSPTINQLKQQWNYIENNFEEIISVKTPENPFELYNLREIFKCDNNKKCTGESDQIKAIETYFEMWINSLDENNTAKKKKDCITGVAVFAQNRLSNTTKTKHLKIILKHLRKNKEFNEAFVKQIIATNI